MRRFGALLNLRRSPESSSAFLALQHLSTVPAQQSMRSTHEFIVLRLFVQRMLASSNLANSFHCIFSRFGSLGRRPAPGPLFRSLPTECTRIAIVELLTSSRTLIQHNQVENSLHTEAVSIQAKRCSGCVWAGYGCHSCFDCRSDSSRNSVLSIRSIPSKAILADTQDKCIS